MRKIPGRFARILLLGATLIPLKVMVQQPEPEKSATHSSGTLNIILANKNGFVIATDSRMSSDDPFHYEDNSQKLFRTTSRSAMAIAGFAVGRWSTPSPLDFTLASTLRKVFGANGLAIDEESRAIPGFVENVIEHALIGVAAVQSPSTPSQNLSVIATFARIDVNHAPILQQMILSEAWTQMGPLHVLAPQYSSNISPPVPITHFVPVTVGIKFVADAILEGVYKSNDPVIQAYYRRRKCHQLEDMTLDEMSTLARVILQETRKLTDYVGGDDQIAVFPSNGDPTFSLPRGLSTETQTIERFMRWEGLLCTSTQTPPCGNVPLSLSINPAQPTGEVRFTKFLLASQFKDIPVVLDNNLFIADSFEGVTFKWGGAPFLSYRNTFKDCVLEVTTNAQEKRHPDLATACRVVRKSVIDLPPNTIGLPVQVIQGSEGSFGLPRDLRP